MASFVQQPVKLSTPSIQGDFVDLDGEPFYRIANYDALPPFLMTLVSSGDLWMYVSSRGGLTAGRECADHCLFPYETVDKLHHCHTYTGPLSLIRYRDSTHATKVWHPFAGGVVPEDACQRDLYKHLVGDQVLFTETNEPLGLKFSYSWQASRRFGFVRTSTLENIGASTVEVDLLDGFLNLQPFGIELTTSQTTSCLADAYKQNECDPTTGVGIFCLTAQIHDRPEAAEILQATTVWCLGLEDYVVLLSTDQIPSFCKGHLIQGERLSTGRRGHYLVSTSLQLAPGERRTWRLVADVAQDHCQVAQLQELLSESAETEHLVQQSLEHDRQNLVRLVASADGLQQTGNPIDSAHHFANVLFNNMRGGVFASNCEVETSDFGEFVASRNHTAFLNAQKFLAALPPTVGYEQLLGHIREQKDRDLLRLGFEYLPLFFGRRHGDPSRPWNQFNIRADNSDGSHAYYYEGNWRDIFQNWESLGYSFPVFFPSIIAKFLNASTVDGFNPYRITREGLDWEVPEPGNPWSNIGYWGDHQAIYLVKLLEACRQHFPGLLEQQLGEENFCYAEVPYRIKPYKALLANCRDTIQFDEARATILKVRVEELGEDAKLLRTSEGKICYVNLVEKLLVPVLAKLSNLVLDGGIWMNTQRPEWNDANNALAGHGLSVVTTCYVRRYIKTLRSLLKDSELEHIDLSKEVAEWLLEVRAILSSEQELLQKPVVSDESRRSLLDALGLAFCKYRSTVYECGFSGKKRILRSDLLSLLDHATCFLDHTIEANVRPDGLFHSYNLLGLHADPPAAQVSPLNEMLEGQVAALSTGKVQPVEAIGLIEEMFNSPLFRADQNSFMLYPDRTLPAFMERNDLPPERVLEIALLRRQLENGQTTLVTNCVQGRYHFNNDIRRESALSERLDSLSTKPTWAALVKQDARAVKELFEEVFRHSQFTGRSGAMYGYEGLGSIYWHMVSKLLLAVQEVFFRAVEEDASESTVRSLRELYYRIRYGLGLHKTPQEYGAFPTDPYSHTPRHAGAQQPGMTGQVKEEILTRRGELGIRIREGRIFSSHNFYARKSLSKGQPNFATTIYMAICMTVNNRLTFPLLHLRSLSTKSR